MINRPAMGVHPPKDTFEMLQQSFAKGMLECYKLQIQYSTLHFLDKLIIKMFHVIIAQSVKS